MAKKRRAAMEVVQWRTPTEVWLDHAEIIPDDVDRFSTVEKLTLWNVTYPEGMFAALPKLWWLDIRGGSASGLHSLTWASRLRYLSLNQIRGAEDLQDISSLECLELLSLYGLPKVRSLPDLRGLSRMRRIEIGQMKGLSSLEPVWAINSLTEILLIKDVPVGVQDIEQINRMPNLRAFCWDALDVPARRFMPIREGVSLPRTQSMFAKDWFDKGGGRPEGGGHES